MSNSVVDDLSMRELQVAMAISDGQTVAEMADALAIHFETARFHIRKLRDKTGLRRKPQLAVWAVEHRLRLASRLRKLTK